MQAVHAANGSSLLRATRPSARPFMPIAGHLPAAALRQGALFGAQQKQRAATVAAASFSSTSSPHRMASHTAAAAAAPAALATRRSRGAVLVRASWGAPVEFKPAKVVSNKQVANNLHTLLVDVGAELAAGYTKPGQFMQVKVGGEDAKPSFFAIASPPDPNNQGVLEVLVKGAAGAADTLVAAREGDQVQVSPVMGKGFPIEKIPSGEFPTVLLFATGTGISPVRALLESGALEQQPDAAGGMAGVGARRCVRLYYGTRSKESTAYLDLIPEWEASGVEVVHVYSEENGGKYVQDVLAEDQAVLIEDPKQVGVVLVGQKGMVEAVKGLLGERGVDTDKMLLNF